jgi:hypothetical protein
MERHTNPIPYFPLPGSTSSRRGGVATGFGGLPRRNAPASQKRSIWKQVSFVRGQIIIELLVAFGLAAVFFPALLTGLISAGSGKVQQQQRIEAVGLLKEGEEAVRSVREADWTKIATNGIYYPKVVSSAWTLSTDIADKKVMDFDRTIQIADTSPSDPSLKKVTVKVSWNNILPANVSTTFYLARWKNISSPVVTSGTLINQGNGDWCSPTLTITALDLPKNGVANAISAIQGQIAAGTGDNASGISYANVTVTDPAAPTNPSASVVGTFDGFKTNGVFTEQNYAYLATDTNAKEVEIINLTQKDVNNKYAEAGYFNAPGQGNAASVATSGNTGFMVGGNKLYSFDLSSKTGSRPIVDPDGLTLPGNAKHMVLWGQRAYVVMDATNAQLVIVDISDTADLKIKRTVGLPALGGAAVFVNAEGTRAYIATRASASQNELFIINTDETSAQYGSVVNSYDTNGMDPKGVVVVNIPRLVIVGTGGEEYQVINIIDETVNPLPRCGGLQIDTGVNGVSTVFTTAQRAYSYIVTGDSSTELKIIEGGPGGGGTGGGLTVESPILDIGHNVIFNRIDITSLTPAEVTATYQVAVSTDCLTFNYTGNYTVAGGPIPISLSPGRCFRYKVTFSGGAVGGTGVSTTVSVNYSP